MSGSALFHIAFIGAVVVILLTVWAAMVFEAGEDPPGRRAGHSEATEQKRTPS